MEAPAAKVTSLRKIVPTGVANSVCMEKTLVISAQPQTSAGFNIGLPGRKPGQSCPARQLLTFAP